MNKSVLFPVALIIIIPLILGGCGGISEPTTTAAQTTNLDLTPTFTQGSVYGIKILEVKKTDEPIHSSQGGGMFKITSPAEGYIFLAVKVQIFKNGVLLEMEDIENDDERISLVDINGESHKALDSFLFDIDEDGKISNKVTFYFVVSENSTGFKLRYRDVPFIDLGL